MIVNKHDQYYLLGFAYLNNQLEDGKLVISKRRLFNKMLTEISIKFYNRNIVRVNGDTVSLMLDDSSLIKLFADANAFETNIEKKHLPKIIDDYAWSFIAGYFDGYGDFKFNADSPRIFLHSPYKDIIDLTAKWWKVRTPHIDKVAAHGFKALDICGHMYANVTIRNLMKYYTFLDILNFSPRPGWTKEHPTFKYVKLSPKAVAPRKERVTDSGYDLSAIEMSKMHGTVYKCKTGLAIKPVPGYYFDLIGRSSLPEKGWQLLQGVGVIDRSFTGELIMHLQKLNDAPMPEFPFKCAQLIPRQIVHLGWEEVKDLGESDREGKGFGSSG